MAHILSIPAAQDTLKVVKELAKRGIKPRCDSKFWSKGLICRILTNELFSQLIF
jgi:hypothetical protein